MDDQQLLSALSGDPQQDVAAVETDLITDAADVEDIIDQGASLSLEDNGEESVVLGGVEPFPQERDEVDEIRRQRDEAVAILQQQQRQAQQQQAYQYWEGSRQQADAAFAAQEKKIYQDAESAYDATAYIKEKMAVLNQQKDQWRTQYYAAREASLRQAAERMAVPSYAQELSSHYQLTPEATKELLTFPPEMMAKVADIMARTSTQQNRSQAARSMSQRMVAPGSGRSSGRIKAGSDAHLYALLRGVAE